MRFPLDLSIHHRLEGPPSAAPRGRSSVTESKRLECSTVSDYWYHLPRNYHRGPNSLMTSTLSTRQPLGQGYMMDTVSIAQDVSLQ